MIYSYITFDVVTRANLSAKREFTKFALKLDQNTTSAPQNCAQEMLFSFNLQYHYQGHERSKR